ncbi:uncharacterized protein G2W53_002099 [Senna tora]|uniref:Uncharacterized protein n=1 Tax=Senna tora TaxID=362788 RepID=A0A834XJ48_9FABA|nr:uncharacterized protein G2W53_002099 [Senna tora]
MEGGSRDGDGENEIANLFVCHLTIATSSKRQLYGSMMCDVL